jgi:hypothetical protein
MPRFSAPRAAAALIGLSSRVLGWRPAHAPPSTLRRLPPACNTAAVKQRDPSNDSATWAQVWYVATPT